MYIIPWLIYFSDDDFEPYDMSNDTVVNKIKQPSYIRDCIEGKYNECLLLNHQLNH